MTHPIESLRASDCSGSRADDRPGANDPRPHRMLAVALVAAALTLGAGPVQAATLTVELNHVTSDQGTLNVAVYDSEQSFRKTVTRGVRVPARKGSVSVEIDDLPAGDYAVMVFHDLDDDGELATNLLGIPKEPWGGSLQGRSVFGAPGWKDVRFELPETGTSIEISFSD